MIADFTGRELQDGWATGEEQNKLAGSSEKL